MRIIYSYLRPLWLCARKGHFSWQKTTLRNYRTSWSYVSLTYYVQLTIVPRTEHFHAAQILKGSESLRILLKGLDLSFLVSRIRTYLQQTQRPASNQNVVWVYWYWRILTASTVCDAWLQLSVTRDFNCLWRVTSTFLGLKVRPWKWRHSKLKEWIKKLCIQ
jgi:hypothetical protein